MLRALQDIARALEDISVKKDQALFVWIRKYWPQNITPNHLTAIRIVIGSYLFIILFGFKINHGFFIMPLFIIGVLTDLFDGAVARCLNQETKLGALLDPLADRVLILPIAIYTVIGYPLLLFFLIFLEIMNASISLFVHGKKIFFGSNIFGKTKMVLQSFVFVAILLFWPQKPSPFFILLLWISAALLVVSIIFKLIEVKTFYANKNI